MVIDNYNILVEDSSPKKNTNNKVSKNKAFNLKKKRTSISFQVTNVELGILETLAEDLNLSIEEVIKKIAISDKYKMLCGSDVNE